MEKYIVIENLNKKYSKQEYSKTNNNIELVNINLASKDEIINLKGIGDSYAERIIKYRDILGGYYSIDQLMEVYGMDSIRFLGFKDQIIIDTSSVRKINLNSAGFKTLIKHPYLNKYETDAILKYKELVGEFKSFDEILNNNLINKEAFVRIKPYLKIETK